MLWKHWSIQEHRSRCCLPLPVLQASKVLASNMLQLWCLASSHFYVLAAAASLHILISLQCLLCLDISA